MLILKDVRQYQFYRFFRSAFIQHLLITFLIRQVIYAVIDGLDSRFIQFTLAIQNYICTCCQQDIIIKRWNKQSSEPIKKLRIQIKARTAAVTNNVSIVAVEYHHSRDACRTFHFHPITDDIIYRIIE